jgi:hypothetical protein
MRAARRRDAREQEAARMSEIENETATRDPAHGNAGLETSSMRPFLQGDAVATERRFATAGRGEASQNKARSAPERRFSTAGRGRVRR